MMIIRGTSARSPMPPPGSSMRRYAYPSQQPMTSSSQRRYVPASYASSTRSAPCRRHANPPSTRTAQPVRRRAGKVQLVSASKLWPTDSESVYSRSTTSVAPEASSASSTQPPEQRVVTKGLTRVSPSERQRKASAPYYGSNSRVSDADWSRPTSAGRGASQSEWSPSTRSMYNQTPQQTSFNSRRSATPTQHVSSYRGTTPYRTPSDHQAAASQTSNGLTLRERARLLTSPAARKSPSCRLYTK